MKGYIDSIAFEFDSCILAKFHLFGVERVAKNGIIFDESLLEMFLSNRMTKSKKKQLIELKNLYSYLAILETQTGLKYKVMQHKRAKKVNITFQGLKQYTEVSELMEHDLKDFIELYRDYISIMRLDVAIDNKEPFNKDKIARNTNRIISESTAKMMIIVLLPFALYSLIISKYVAILNIFTIAAPIALKNATSPPKNGSKNFRKNSPLIPMFYSSLLIYE